MNSSISVTSCWQSSISKQMCCEFMIAIAMFSPKDMLSPALLPIMWPLHYSCFHLLKCSCCVRWDSTCRIYCRLLSHHLSLAFGSAMHFSFSITNCKKASLFMYISIDILVDIFCQFVKTLCQFR